MDSETGEMITAPGIFDVETGEMCAGGDIELQCNMRKTKFNVPRSYLTNSSPPKPKCCLDSQETFTLTSKRKVIELKEVSFTLEPPISVPKVKDTAFPFQKIILGHNKTSHRLFLIPSLFFFPRIAAIFIMVTEITLHVWSHRKNTRNDNPKIYYRSPLHALTSQFCNLCLDTKELHNERYHKKKRVVASSLQ